MTYTIGFNVHGVYFATVEAENAEEAKMLAEQEYYNADFGELSDIDGEAYTADDENDNRTYFY